jgi:hypothetical protein
MSLSHDEHSVAVAGGHWWHRIATGLLSQTWHLRAVNTINVM